MFLPLSNLTTFQRLILDPGSAPAVLEAMTAEMLAAGMGMTTFTPPRPPQDPEIVALADTFAYNDGVAVLHETIQYLVERSQNERGWLDALAASEVPTTLVWGLYDTVSPLRVANHVWSTFLAAKPGTNEFWLLPRANHYLQNDQPAQFAEVIRASMSESEPEPGAVGDSAEARRSSSIAPAASCPPRRRCCRSPRRSRPCSRRPRGWRAETAAGARSILRPAIGGIPAGGPLHERESR